MNGHLLLKYTVKHQFPAIFCYNNYDIISHFLHFGFSHCTSIFTSINCAEKVSVNQKLCLCIVGKYCFFAIVSQLLARQYPPFCCTVPVITIRTTAQGEVERYTVTTGMCTADCKN